MIEFGFPVILENVLAGESYFCLEKNEKLFLLKEGLS